MASAPRVLVVDTSSTRAFALQQQLDASGFESSHSLSVAAGVASLQHSTVDVIVVAARDAGDVSPLLGEADHAQVVVRVDDVVGTSAARTWGAYDVLSLDATFETLLPVIDRAAREAGMRRELAVHRSRTAHGVAAALIGKSSAMAHVRELIGRAAASQRTVLVTGEAGVGKDVVARLIHDLSERATRPYLLMRCSDASSELLEEELFGVTPSAAILGRVGLLETARGGTVVLDDCTALSSGLRARIAHTIVTRSATRLGGETAVSLDVRFVLMARDPEALGSSGVGAEALLSGVSVDRIVVPPLRERRSDVPQLVQHFRARLALENGHDGRAPAANSMVALMAQQWPGNVRELEHRVERDQYGTNEPLPAPTRPATAGMFAVLDSAPWTIEQLERRYIEHVLAQEGGNQSRAADRLGIDRRTLYRKLKEYRDDDLERTRAG
jgi:DNA-binding NtrC family response regulator